MMVIVGMSTTWRACGMMPQFFVEKDSECASPSPPPPFYMNFYEVNSRLF